MTSYNRQRQSTSWEKMFTFDSLEKPVQQHLKNVYSCLAISMLAAAAGGYIHLFTSFSMVGLLSDLVSIGLLLLLYMTPHNTENQMKRFGYLMSFAFLMGMGLGPLLDFVIAVDPSIIPTALLATTIIFTCFSLSALLSNDRKWLYMGGMLFSGLSWMLLLSLLNLFIGSRLLWQVELYIGFFIMCGFVLYDTQLIVEKRRRGDDDYIWHCVDLFIDFISLFRRLMLILSSGSSKKKRED